MIKRGLGWLLASLPVMALGGAPFWFGLEAEKIHAQWTQSWADTHGLKISGVHYERGWLASNATYAVTLPTLPLQIQVVHTIQHGPFVLDRLLADPASVLAPVQAVVHSELTLRITGAPGQALGALPPLTADTVIDIRGQGVSTLAMAPLKKSLAGGTTVEVKGAEGRLDFDTQWQALRTELALAGIVVTDAQKTLEVGRVTATSDLQASAHGYFAGSVAVALERATVPALGASLAGLRVSSTTREAGKLLNTRVQYALREFTLGDERYGPANIVLELRKLDADALMKLQRALREAQKPGTPPQQAALMAMGHLLNIVGTLAKSAPELEVTQASVRLPAGEITGEAKFVLDGSKLDLAANPMLVVSAFRGDGTITVPAGVVEALARRQAQRELDGLKASGQLNANELARLTPQKVSAIVDQAAPQHVDTLARQLQLVREGSDYRLKASIRQGRLLVNGQPLAAPLPLRP